MRANFKANFPKMAKLEVQNLSLPTFFEIKAYNFEDVTFKSILREFLLRFLNFALNFEILAILQFWRSEKWKHLENCQNNKFRGKIQKSK